MSLAAIRLPPPAAAAAIQDLWDEGEAVLPLDPRAPADDVRRTIAALRPTHLIDGEGRRPLDGGVAVAPEVAAVVTTSGTTGIPRGVELTWDGLRTSAQAVSKALDLRRTDSWLCCLPLHHIAGLAIVARAWATGAGLVVLPGFDPAVLDEPEATLVSLVPTTLRRALDAGTDLARFRRVLVGGTAVPEGLCRRAAAAGVNLVTTYGLTETWGGIVHDGLPLPGVRLRLGGARAALQSGRPRARAALQSGRPRANEIEARGPMVMRGYRLAPDETAAVLDADGWLRTGDAGVFDADGRLHVVDRLTDVIITGGVNVGPTEVEAVLADHPAVADVCVSGAPDATWGERVVAYVVPAAGTPPPDLATLRAFAADKLAAAKLPRQVVVVDEIPRTPGGKVIRRRLA